jgi:hypothetical protein
MGGVEDRTPGAGFMPAHPEPAMPIPSDMPAITHAEMVQGIADGGYIRGVMVEAQEPENHTPRYAVYILTTWRTGYRVFHIAYPARRGSSRISTGSWRCSGSSSGFAVWSACGSLGSRSPRGAPASAAPSQIRLAGPRERNATIRMNLRASLESDACF